MDTPILEIVNDWAEFQYRTQMFMKEHEVYYGYEINREEAMLALLYTRLKKLESDK